MSFSIGDAVVVELTGHPLNFMPRFDISVPSVTVASYGDMEGREQLIGSTFGSAQWLWSEDDDVHFDRTSRELVAASFFVPRRAAPKLSCKPASDWPLVQPGGLRADRRKEFALPQTTLFCCAPEASLLRCVHDPEMLDVGPDARVGIAQDLALLVREQRLIGWELTDPARYLTTHFAEPEAAPPSSATRLRVLECLELISSPLVDDVADQEPAALQRLRQTERALRDQRGDQRRYKSCTRSSAE